MTPLTGVLASIDSAASAAGCAAERMHIVVTGHVDHGKSTVVGRLLADTGSLPEGKLDAVRATCARHAKPFEYAFLIDALKDEQAQGITIDAARVFFKTARRHYVIVDAPGHIEFLKNMITGASRAEAALLVIDANEGIQENTCRHGYLLSLLGIRQIAVLVNKMDLVGHSPAVFDRLVSDFTRFLDTCGVAPLWFIPVSARGGENLTAASVGMAWYRGPTVLEALDSFENRPPVTAAAFRMPVQAVYKFTAQHDDRRIVAGTVESGRVSIGDELIFYPSGKKSRVRSIEAFNRAPCSEASAGQATGLTLTDQIYVRRGEIAALAAQPKPLVGTRLSVSLFWLGRQPLVTGKDYVLKLGTARVPMRVERIDRVVDASTLSSADTPARVERHEVAECTIVLRKPLAFDAPDRCSATSRFVVVDGFEISGGGIVREVLRHAGAADAPLVSGAAVIWLTGLSGAGKSTIAAEVCTRLRAGGVGVECLDGDAIRDVFPNTGFSPAERDAHIRRVGFMASRLEHHGVFVVCALIAPYAASRAAVRSMCRRFVEVHVCTPLEECERRDVKGLYERARRGELQNFTGVADAYEPPKHPEVRIDTTGITVGDAADLVMAALERTDIGDLSDEDEERGAA